MRFWPVRKSVPKPPRERPIIFSDACGAIVRDCPLVYVDAGARGGLQGTWAEVDDDRLRVVAFEADPDGIRELQGRSNFDVIGAALWSDPGTVDIHLAAIPTTSSVYPPNWSLLERFLPQHSEPRRTVEVASIPCTTIDASLKQVGRRADFIKLDTQGSEFEILSGAEEALAESVFGVVAESWTIEVHKGQRTTGEILSFMHQRGFSLFDMSVGAAWHRRGADRLKHLNKRQIVGLDLLFFREPSLAPGHFATPVAAAKAAAIAEMYGFPDLALEIIDLCRPTGLEEISSVQAMRRLIVDGLHTDATSLHY